jgi:hypothetical protein
MKQLNRFAMVALIASALLLSIEAASSQDSASSGTSIPKTLDSGKAVAVFGANCSGCHDWAGAWETIVVPAFVVPGKPSDSPAWIAISEDRMPATGPLGEADRAIILEWIQAGAPRPLAADATSAATPLPSGRFLGFKSKESFHRFSGWASGGLLLAAGVVGAVHAYDMMSEAHDYRDTFPEDSLNDGNSPICKAKITSVWGSSTEQALRWTHVGLLAAGESFYIANAITGTSFMGKLGPGWSKAKIHRYAFFTHAGLMAAEAVMGFFTSDALRRGDHETIRTLGIAHAGVGLVIPVVILGAGAIMDPGIKFGAAR